MKANLGFFLCVFSYLVSSSANAAADPRVDSPFGLDLEHLQLLEQSDEFHFDLYERERNGRREVILALGESHAKSSNASVLGKDVIKHFNGHLGVEGAGSDNYFLGRQLAVGVKAYHKIFGFAFWGLDSKPSTIHDAHTSEDRKLVFRLEEGHHPSFFENATLFSAVTAPLYMVGRVVRTVVRGASQKGRSSESSEDTAEKIEKNPEEEGKKKSEAATSGCEQTVIASIQPPEPASPPKPVKTWLGRLDSAVHYSYAGIVGGNIWLYLDPSIPWGLLGARNFTMMKNAIGHLESQENPKPLMAIMGSAHLHGFGYFLEQRGFKKVNWKTFYEQK